MTKQPKPPATRSAVCAFRTTPAIRKKVDAKLKQLNAGRDASLPAWGVGDFFHAATLAMLADDDAVCREWLADLASSL